MKWQTEGKRQIDESEKIKRKDYSDQEKSLLSIQENFLYNGDRTDMTDIKTNTDIENR